MLTKENVYGKIKKLIWKTMLCRCSSMVECQPSKLNTWVRFPSPAPNNSTFLEVSRGDKLNSRPIMRP